MLLPLPMPCRPMCFTPCCVCQVGDLCDLLRGWEDPFRGHGWAVVVVAPSRHQGEPNARPWGAYITGEETVRASSWWKELGLWDKGLVRGKA